MRHELRIPEAALAITTPYLRSLLAGDRGEAMRIAVELGLQQGVTVPDLELRMIMPAQREIGRLWEENCITVAQEHLATSLSQLVLARLYQHLPRARANGKQVLVACVAGERHELGARVGADFLEMVGFEVRFLGANIETSRIVRAVREHRPDLVGLSATMHFHLPALREAIDAVRTISPALPIVVGGGLMESDPALAEELAVQAGGRDAHELAVTCLALLGCETPAPVSPR